MDSKQYITLNNQLNTMDTYIFSTPEKQTELGLDGNQLMQFQAYKTQFNTIMVQYLDPAKRTTITTKTTLKDYKTITTWIKNLRQIIKTSKHQTLTQEDYTSLFIHQDKTPSKHSTPTTTPTLELEHIEHLEARLSAHHNASFTKGTKPSLPEKIDIIDWQWTINDIRESIDTLVYENHQTTQSATLKLSFNPSQTGQFCHLIACYGITNGQIGAFSNSLSFAIT